jgi:hypothetical protein
MWLLLTDKSNGSGDAVFADYNVGSNLGIEAAADNGNSKGGHAGSGDLHAVDIGPLMGA